ncbi:MAG: hypothetical protein OES99_09875, partial [Gammaproteobacteria bacterium]|nr:hypothetical protein [Gammaproteobacteria bacterium]
LLAGLLQDVGMVVLLGALADYGEDFPAPDKLHDGLEEWAPRVGQMLLESWEFDQRYIDVVKARHDWMRDQSDKPDLADIVTLARLHSYSGKKRSENCPLINEIPAYKKLPVGLLTEQMSLQALVDANAEVDQIRSMLRG